MKRQAISNEAMMRIAKVVVKGQFDVPEKDELIKKYWQVVIYYIKEEFNISYRAAEYVCSVATNTALSPDLLRWGEQWSEDSRVVEALDSLVGMTKEDIKSILEIERQKLDEWWDNEGRYEEELEESGDWKYWEAENYRRTR